MRILLTCIFISLTFILFAQHTEADKKNVEIDSFKKYSLLVLEGIEVELMRDSTTEVTKMVHYSVKGDKEYSSKIAEYSKKSFGEVTRTYYFYGQQSRLFAIIDEIKLPNGIHKKLTYYFSKKQLIQVIDENNIDVTNTIDK